MSTGVQRVHSPGDRFDADDTKVLRQESTNPSIPALREKHLPQAADARAERVPQQARRIIMDAILPQRAPGPYYRQWPLAFPKE